MYMTKQPDNHTATVLNELYKIDPNLKQFEADLPYLIASLEIRRPEVTIDHTFVRELRTSLLSHKPASDVRTTTISTTAPLFWWLKHLTPVGISLLLFLVLVPELNKAPTAPSAQEQPVPETFEVAPQSPTETESEMRKDGFMPETMEEEAADDNSMFFMEAAPSSLQVAPPLSGDTLTISSLLLPEASWIVVHKDNGGRLGDILHSSFLAPGDYQNFPLILTEPLLYPELVTVVLYTATNTEQFDAAVETVHIDPLTDSPMMVTVPVISELELME